MNIYDGTAMSVSAYDDNVNDMISANLFTRDWKLIGTTPPGSPVVSDQSNDSITDHLIMFYQEHLEQMRHNAINESREDSMLKPLVLSRYNMENIEVIPVKKECLGPYYNYFSTCVSSNIGDELINVCRPSKKSPVFDITGCYLVAPYSNTDVHPESLANVTVTEDDKATSIKCAALIPGTIVENMIESLMDIGISVVPDIHDAYAFNSSRVRMSSMYTSCDIPKKSWKGNTFTRDLRRIVRCSAVTTATLTVSIVLGIAYGSKSVYKRRKTLSIIVHAIK